METTLIGGNEYQIGKLLPFDQFHVSRKIAPIIPTIAPMLSEFISGGWAEKVTQLQAPQESEEGDKPNLPKVDLQPLADSSKPFFDALAAMPEQDADYVITKCLAVVQRRPADGGSWAKVCPTKHLMFDDMDMSVILPLVITVLRVNLGAFMAGLATSPLNQTSQP